MRPRRGGDPRALHKLAIQLVVGLLSKAGFPGLLIASVLIATLGAGLSVKSETVYIDDVRQLNELRLQSLDKALASK